jgi:hypothetical protein
MAGGSTFVGISVLGPNEMNKKGWSSRGPISLHEPGIRLQSQFFVRTAQQTSHLLFEAFERCRLGVDALRPLLGGGRGRLATGGGRRRGFFQDSSLLELAGQLHAGVDQLDCASGRQYNPSDNMPPASRLGGWRFRFIQAGRAKFESQRLAIENALAQGIGERFPYVVSFFSWKLRRWHSERHGCSSEFPALTPDIIPWINIQSSSVLSSRPKRNRRFGRLKQHFDPPGRFGVAQCPEELRQHHLRRRRAAPELFEVFICLQMGRLAYTAQ